VAIGFLGEKKKDFCVYKNLCYNGNMKKIIFIIIFVLIGFGVLTGGGVSAQEELEINFFYSLTCSHCTAERKFLAELIERHPEIVVKRYEISETETAAILEGFYKEYEVPKMERGLVPITFTRERYFLGFNDLVARELEGCVESCIAGEEGEEINRNRVSLPLIGEVDLDKYSLPMQAIILGFFDGFNVCSLGALVLILGLVLALKSRKKILIFGGLFIFTTALVYGLLIVLWYKLFLVLAGYLRMMKVIVALLGIGGGFYFLRQFIKFRKQGPTCDISVGKGIMAKFSRKMQDSLKRPGNIIMVGLSVLLFAVVITIVEFPCSAVIPVFFAGALSQAELPAFYWIFYILVFVLFYMLDELVVFLIAASKMTIWMGSGKFMTWITLVEAIVLFLLGGYYLIGL